MPTGRIEVATPTLRKDLQRTVMSVMSVMSVMAVIVARKPIITVTMA
jgi:hypothetical protein